MESVVQSNDKIAGMRISVCDVYDYLNRHRFSPAIWLDGAPSAGTGRVFVP
jgi:hypothetical protein